MKKRGIMNFWSAVVMAICLAIPHLSVSALAAQDPGITLEDDKTGHQIQLVYVETSSAKGSRYDTNGQIETWVNQLQAWLSKQTGKELIFDTYQGRPDIAYLKFNGNITYEGTGQKQLVQMYQKSNPNTYYGKTLAFIIDQTRPVGSVLCGWAGPNEGYALIFPNLTFSDGTECTGDDTTSEINSGFSYPAKSLLHEIIHSYGVEAHVCVDTTDLMHGSPECEEAGIVQDFEKPVTFDLLKRYYFGGNRAGVDLKTLKIWTDGTGQKRPELDQGICWVGEVCPFKSNTFEEQGTVQLQVKSGNKWITVNSVKGQLSNCQDCYKYSFKNSHRFIKPGTYQYRIVKLATKKYAAYTGPSKTIRVLN